MNHEVSRKLGKFFSGLGEHSYKPEFSGIERRLDRLSVCLKKLEWSM
jgi:hypothetical protein